MSQQMEVDFGWMCSSIANQVTAAAQAIAGEWASPHILYRPTLAKDGNMWCALLGENLQEGIAGFGPTPFLAMRAFDTAFLSESGSHIIDHQGEIKEADHE